MVICFTAHQAVVEKDAALFQLRRWPEVCDERQALSGPNYVQLVVNIPTQSGAENSTYLLTVDSAGQQDGEYEFRFIQEDTRHECTESRVSVEPGSLFRLTYNVHCVAEEITTNKSATTQ